MDKSLNGPITTDFDMINLMAVLEWLRRMSKSVRFGKDNYIETLTVIRGLIGERRELNKQVDKLQAEIARLQLKIKPVKAPFDIGGDGSWGNIA